jgi:dihydrofolate reductase
MGDPGQVRRIIMMMSVSVDGYFESTDRELTWQLIDEELHRHFNTELAQMSAFLDGRVTYELMAGYWPTADEDPANAGPVAEFAAIWRDMPKVVYSRTLDQADWNTAIAREVVPSQIEALKSQPGGDMAIGGADLGATFGRLNLIDEYRLYVHPVLLGAGHRLFPAGPPVRLHLTETRTFASGVVLLRYETGKSRDTPVG